MVRFRKQGEEIRNLSHSAIVPVLDVFREMGHNVVVMKLFLGPYGRPVNLTDYSRDFGPANSLLDEQDMQQIITVVLHTLTHAHDHGIVHCDLKPENILFQYLKMDDPQHWLADVRITDFGLAKIVGEELLLQSASQSRDTFPTSMLTATAPPDARALIGTYEYMSPEQRRGYPASPYSDIFAVGVMMLRMLTGYTELGLRMRPSTLRPGLSPDWDDIIIRAMRESPPQRFASPAELAEAVAGIKLGDTARDSRNEDFKSRTVRLETRPWD
jgi:serine/threonine-protein kinase